MKQRRSTVRSVMYKAAPRFSGGDPSLAGREATDLSASTTHGASDLFSVPYSGSGTRPTTNIHEQRTSNPPRCASSPLQRVRPGRLPPNFKSGGKLVLLRALCAPTSATLSASHTTLGGKRRAPSLPRRHALFVSQTGHVRLSAARRFVRSTQNIGARLLDSSARALAAHFQLGFPWGPTRDRSLTDP